MDELSENPPLKKDLPIVMVKGTAALPLLTHSSLLVPFLFMGRVIVLSLNPLTSE